MNGTTDDTTVSNAEREAKRVMRNLGLRDLKAAEVVGFQVDGRNRVWVCVDGQCVLRMVGAKAVEITDQR